MNIILRRPYGMKDWDNIRNLYVPTFPPPERKPLPLIRRMIKAGKSDLWLIEADGSFAGFMATVNGSDTIMLDYFAVLPERRSQGIGRAAMEEYKKLYDGKGLFVEIERVRENAKNYEERLRRQNFYLRCGYAPLGVQALVFGVDMELLGIGCTMTLRGYQSFYRENYSSFAANNIREIEEGK